MQSLIERRGPSRGAPPPAGGKTARQEIQRTFRTELRRPLSRPSFGQRATASQHNELGKGIGKLIRRKFRP